MKMPEFLNASIERRNNIYLFQLYLIQVSYYQRKLYNNFKPFNYYFKNKYKIIVAELIRKIAEILTTNPWLANNTSKVLDSDDWQQLSALPDLIKMSAYQKNRSTKLIKHRYFPLHLAILLKNYSLAKNLIKLHDASVGAYDVNSDTQYR